MATKAEEKYVTQPSAAPTTKMAAVGVSGAVTVVVLALLAQFTTFQVSPEVASAITIIVAWLVGYFTKEQVQVG